MTRLPTATFAIVLPLLLSLGVPTAKAAVGAVCTLPSDLQRDLASRYPRLHVASVADLLNDDRALFAKEHGDDCPGESTLDFYGNGQPTVVVNLVASDHKSGILAVATKVHDTWRLKQIDTTTGSTPAVWADRPGKYVDVESGKEIDSSRPVIVWCGYEAWAIVYAWTGSAVEKVWIAD